MSGDRRPSGLTRNLNAKIAAVPMILTALVVFVGCSIWSIGYSFTSSNSLPVNEFVGLAQYERLFKTSRWIVSLKNIAIYGVFSIFFSLTMGFLLAALLDQKVRFENVFRTIFLYPFALSFIVTGLVWQWILNPTFGIEHVVRGLGFETFSFAPLSDRNTVIYALLIAGLWQGTGLVMAIMLAGLRGVDEEIWKASRVEGIPAWRVYVSVIIPMMKPVFVTTLVLIGSGIVRLYDLVIAMTNGGPGASSEVPAKYVYDFMFSRGNLGQGLAASTIMLIVVITIMIPWIYIEYGPKKRA
ncbi:carbohydrate ABC transporter permease [Chthonobacter albigriseus]|uniref:carbohydrate ABC transporter permease n=1 Tax=Chthonobacter albigriseus TaxID=1683161 RepID=UPI0015EE8719|nr:sugar ABC transporter permease [Chthonobacter albigriseus]